MGDSEKVDFESSLAELEKLVESMEKGELTLEESLQAYEKGIELTNRCRSVLEDAKKRIDDLSKQEILEED